MSRFLDAMRNQRKPTGGDDEAREYKGQIVDTSDVLGARVDRMPDDEVEALSALPFGADNEASAQSANGTAVPENPIESIDYSDQQEWATPQDHDSLSQTAGPHAGDSVDVSKARIAASAVKARLNADSNQSPVIKPRAFSLRNLDPFFYLIVGIAAIGLFVCLYALITQNDAYFEREYQQLQKESAALQARLAASTRLEAALTAATAAQVVTPVVAATPNLELESSVGPDAKVETILPKTESVEHELAVLAVAEEQASQSEMIESEAATETKALTNDSQQASAVDNFANESELLLLRQEMDSLRAAIFSQDEKISRLEQDNFELTTIIGGSSVEQKALSNSAESPVVKKNEQAAVQSDSSISSAPVVVDNAPLISEQQNLSVSIKESIVLEAPTSGMQTEVTDLVSQGYLAYQAQNFTAASGFYGKALEFDPYDRDANLGVAATARETGDLKLAEDRYRHLLTLDPADNVAFSALLNLSGSSQSSSAIEIELAQHAEYVNDSQNLYAILGNYYSQRQRWADAEKSYAIAIQAGAGNPDSWFNYAVALDNMGRRVSAVQYYSQALERIDTAPHSFNEVAARQRLQSLLAVDQ